MCRHLVSARDCAEPHVEPVPAIDRNHRERKADEFLFAELLAGRYANLSGYVSAIRRRRIRLGFLARCSTATTINAAPVITK